MAKTEGKAVSVAMNGPALDADELVTFAVERNREDRKRAESAGESRQKIGEYLDETGMNGKALSWCRQILKVNDKGDDGQAKAMDIIMSVEKALPIIKQHVSGQGTLEMSFDEPEEDAIDPVGDDAMFSDLPGPSYDQDFDITEDDPEIAEEADEFEKHLAAVSQ